MTTNRTDEKKVNLHTAARPFFKVYAIRGSGYGFFLGGMGGWHHTAYVRNAEQWYSCDDETVVPRKYPATSKKKPYIPVFQSNELVVVGGGETKKNKILDFKNE